MTPRMQRTVRGRNLVEDKLRWAEINRQFMAAYQKGQSDAQVTAQNRSSHQANT